MPCIDRYGPLIRIHTAGHTTCIDREHRRLTVSDNFTSWTHVWGVGGVPGDFEEFLLQCDGDYVAHKLFLGRPGEDKEIDAKATRTAVRKRLAGEYRRDFTTVRRDGSTWYSESDLREALAAIQNWDGTKEGTFVEPWAGLIAWDIDGEELRYRPSHAFLLLRDRVLPEAFALLRAEHALPRRRCPTCPVTVASNTEESLGCVDCMKRKIQALERFENQTPKR